MKVLGRSSKGLYIHIHDELSRESKRQGETLTSRLHSCPSLNCFIQDLLSAPFITTSSRREVELLRPLRFVPSRVPSLGCRDVDSCLVVSLEFCDWLRSIRFVLTHAKKSSMKLG